MTAPWKSALCSVTFRALRAEQIITLAAAHNISTIEWGGDVHVACGALDVATEVAAACGDASISIGSYGTYLIAGSGTGFRDTPAPDLSKLIDTAKTLGSPALRVWAGKWGSAQATAKQRADTANHLADICAQAGEAQLDITLEYHPNTLTDDADSTHDLIGSVAAHNLFTHWQPRPGLGLDAALRELRSLHARLSYLHVFAWNARAERYPLVEHEDFWPEVLKLINALDEQTPRGWPHANYACLEFVRDDSTAQLGDDATTLNRWLSA